MSFNITIVSLSLAAGCKDEQLRNGMLRKVSELKRSLPAFCWHATFRDGKRKNFAAVPSGLVMIDVDHVESPELLFAKVKERAFELGLVAAHVTPSGFGLRLVFVKPDGMLIEEAQRWLTSQLKLRLHGQEPLCLDEHPYEPTCRHIPL